MSHKRWIVAVVVIVASAAYGGPGTITYQGSVVGSTGTPVGDGMYPMRFSIYVVASGGTAVWQETEPGVSVASGLFSATLGDGTTFGSLFVTFSDLWMEVEIDLDKSGTFQTNERYAPRQKLAGAAWALQAKDAEAADLLDGYHANAFVRSVAAGAGLLRTGTSNTATLSANTAYLQRRVTGTAPAGRFVTGINADGTVATGVDQVGTGDITGVTAGTGLTGGGASGNVTLNVQFGGTGAATAAARSDHTNSWASLTGLPAGFADGLDNDSGGDITGVTAGTGLTGGGTSGTVTISADTAYLQRRVTGTAPAYQFVKAVNADGSVVTSAAITGVAAGTGLTGGGTSGSVSLAVSFAGSGAAGTASRSDHNHDAAYVNEGQANSVTSAMIVNGTVTTSDISDGTINAVDLRDGAALAEILDNDGAASGLDADLLDGVHAAGLWNTLGNSGLTSGTHFLGTTDNVAVDLRVNGLRALRLSPNATSPNILGGYSGNSIAAGVAGAVIAGGGAAGATNFVTDSYGAVGGGQRNRAGNDSGTVSDATYATVGGGYSNTASDNYATVAGGNSNTASGNIATVGGGEGNTASAYDATVGGGYQNTASQQCATVGGGYGNTASFPFTTVGGGYQNTASSQSATIPGGALNRASGSYSLAAGLRARALHTGSFVWGDAQYGYTTSTATNQFIVRAGGRIYLTSSTGALPTNNGFINTSTGGYLSTAGVWTDSSDRNAKENFQAVDGQEILSKLAQLPITQWNYKAENATVQHLGPVAQDFHALFGLGQDDRHIAALDGNGVALAAIQGLHQMLVEKVTEIATLQADRNGQARQLGAQQEQIRALQEQNVTLEARLATIERLVAGR